MKIVRASASTLFAVTSLLAAQAGSAAAQETPTRSTRQGVYTADQATKGQAVFAARCQSCHSPTTHTGPNFFANWAEGRPLSGLVSFVKMEMPYDAPGSLSADEYTQVVAFLLKQNGLPAGNEALPSAESALQAIKFEAPPSALHRR
jgi:S-disulfanyl-L-cysteine oxidoreductase SoxD